MAKEFDIYLRNHLVECDLLIYSIPYREGISVTDRLILEAALNNYVLQKFAAVQMESELTSHIDKMIKLCLEKLSIGTSMNASAMIGAKSSLILENSPVVIDTSVEQSILQVMNEVNSGVVMTVKPLLTDISASSGRIDSRITVDAGVDGIQKRSLLNLKSFAVPGVSIQQIGQVDYIHADLPVEVGVSVHDLCYHLTFGASASFEISAIVLGTDIQHSLGTWYNGTSVGARLSGSSAQKFIAAQTIVSIMQTAVEKLIGILYPNDAVSVIGNTEIEISLKRYRVLSEVDDMDLADIDDMPLADLDFIWIA